MLRTRTSSTPLPGTINVLSPDVASKIAAGEVIERPASVVRELIDNSIDSGAARIRVEIAGGGRDLIKVSDDGCGVAREQMPRAFLRHATSKLRTADDLWTIKTLGFRGEALYSIAAVARVLFRSRPSEHDAGYEMALEGGRAVGEGACGIPPGTSVAVRDLFYNLPARLKFLKSAPAEAAHISGLVQQYALAHPGIRFTLVNEGRVTFQSPGDGDLRSASLCVYGSDVGRALLPVGFEPGSAEEMEGSYPIEDLVDGLQVYGYVSPPAHSRSNRQAMHFFVNTRAVGSKMLQFAVQEAYHTLLMVGRHPICVVNVAVDPSLLDVNVHPAKAEVKFRDERSIFRAVQRAVRSALEAHIPAPTYGTRGAEGWTLPQQQSGSDAEFASGLSWGSAAPLPTQSDIWVEQNVGQFRDEPVEPLPATPSRNMPSLRVVGQLGGTYIVSEGPDGLFLVDQHAAHERILYEQLGAALEAGGLPVQPLLQPLPLEFASSQRAELESVLPLLAELGFELEPFGETALLVRAVPAIYASSRHDLGSDLIDMIDSVVGGSRPEKWREEMAITLACHSAIRAGQALSLDEMRAMMSQLEMCSYPRHCAHGRPTMLHLSKTQLEREFGRRA
jgi:DNA mismatch repair protein MutL